MNQPSSPLRHVQVATKGQTYELIAPSDRLVCPELLAKRLEARLQISAVPQAPADLGPLPLLADSTLQDHAALKGEEVTRWVEATLPLPPLPEPAPAPIEQQVINGTVGRFTERRIQDRLEGTLELPPLPQMARRILALSGNENATALDLVDILEQDAGLAARLVGWANSESREKLFHGWAVFKAFATRWFASWVSRVHWLWRWDSSWASISRTRRRRGKGCAVSGWRAC